MSSVSDAATIVENMLAEGESDRDVLIDAILPLVTDDVRALRWKHAKKRLSLIVSTLKNEHGDRVAFPGRDADGKAIVLHLSYSENARAMRDLAERKRLHARAELRDADRLEERAYQLDMFAQEAA